MRYIESPFSIAACRYGKYYLYHRYVLLIMICCGLMFQSGARHTIYYYCHPIHVLTRNLTDDNINPLGPRCRQWNENERLYVTYAYEAGVTLVQIPAGIGSDLHGGKHYFGVGVVSVGFFSFLLPLVLPGMSFQANMALQFVQGCFAGAAIPSAWGLVSRWAPTYQVAFFSSLHFSFFELGQALASCTTIFFVMDSPLHSGPFYIWGILIAIWYAIFLNMVYSTMMDHPYISEKEREAVIGEIGRIKPQRIPWKKIMRDPSTWAIIAANAGDIALITTISATSSDYLRSVMQADTLDYAIYDLMRAIPQIIGLILVSYIADYVIQHKFIETVYLRSIYACIGSMLPCILLLIAAYLRAYAWTAISFFWIASIITSFTLASVGVNILDRTRNYAGFFTGVTAAIQGGASFTRLLIVIIKKSPERWANIFWFDLAVNFFTTVIYLKFCKGVRAKWDIAETEEDIRVEKLKEEEFQEFYKDHKYNLKQEAEIEPKSQTVVFAN